MQIPRRTRLHTGLIVIAVISIVAVIALGVGAIQTLAARNATTHQYKTSNATLANPDRGWYEPIDDLAANPEAVNSVPSNITLARSFIRLDAYRSTTLPKSLLDRLDEGLDNAERQGVGLIIRFAYNDGPSVGSQDASLATILEHIKQLSPVLHRHPAALAGVEAGFIGAWGEWHGSSNNLDNDNNARRQVLAALTKAVPSPIPIMLRYPYDIRAIQQAWKKDVAQQSALSRLGSHQDCFLASSPDDWGTWGQRGGTVNGDKHLIASLRHAMVGGETCNPSPPTRTQCTTALSEMKLMHFTYLNRRYEPNSLERLRAGGCFGTITAKLGYRFALTSATWPNTVARNDKPITLKIALKNTGFAAPITSRRMTIVLVRNSKRVTFTMLKDVRIITPGKHEYANKFVLPKSMARGTYTVYLGMPPQQHRATATTRNTGIEFANAGIWDAKLQLNKLGTVKVR